MSRRLTQPEEIDLVLREMAEEEAKTASSYARAMYRADAGTSAYVSPYRAEYIKSHGIPDQGEFRQR